MGLFFEKTAVKCTKKKLMNFFILLTVLDLTNNFLLHLSYLSTITICLYIVFIIFFIRELMNRKDNNG